MKKLKSSTSKLSARFTKKPGPGQAPTNNNRQSINERNRQLAIKSSVKDKAGSSRLRSAKKQSTVTPSRVATNRNQTTGTARTADKKPAAKTTANKPTEQDQAAEKQETTNEPPNAVANSPETKVPVTSEVKVIDAKQVRHPSGNLKDVVLRLGTDCYLGHGVFGNVYKSVVLDPPMAVSNVVAVKKIWPQDEEDLQRQLLIYRHLHHENLCRLLFYYKSDAPKRRITSKRSNRSGRHNKHKEVERPCWCLITEFVQTSCKSFHDKLREKDTYLDNLTIQKWTFQMWCGLAYLAEQKVVHRDMKPDNMLLDSRTHMVKIADFGSAKILTDRKTKSITYMVTRYYRPPEMALDFLHYQFKVDVWSGACILGEFYIGRVLLEGDSADHQFELIQQQLGSPTTEEILKMNPTFNMADWRWAKDVKATDDKLSNRLLDGVDPRLLDLLENKLFKYDPDQRLTADEASRHPYYDDLYELKEELPFQLLTDRKTKVEKAASETAVPTSSNIQSSSQEETKSK